MTMIRRAASRPTKARHTPASGAISAGTGLIALALLFPVAGWAVASIVTVMFSRRPVLAGGLSATLLFTGVFAFVNVGKSVSGDWTWYTTHYRYLESTALQDYLGNGQFFPRPDATEPLYYAFASLLSRATGANVDALSIAVTALIYFPLGISLVLAIRTVTDKGGVVFASTSVGILVGLTFTLSTQLVRQEIAAALIAIGLVLFATRRIPIAVVVVIMAILTHNSAVIPASALLAAVVLGSSKGLIRTKILAIGIIFFALGQLYILIEGSNYNGQSDGSISPAVLLLDAFIAAIFVLVYARSRLGENRVARFVILLMPALYAFTIGVASQPIPLLRMYFYIEVVRALVVALLCAHYLQGRFRLLLGVVAILLALLYAEARIFSSPFEYSSTVLSTLLFSPLFLDAPWVPG